MPEDLGYLADLTSVGRVYQYVQKDPNIYYAIRVEESVDMGLLAGQIVLGDTEAEVNISALMDNGSISINPDADSNHEMACHVIRVEPILLYKLNGQRYE